MKNRNIKLKEKGFTLVEILATIFVFSLGILAIYRIIPSFVSGMTLNSSKVTAAYLSQEGIEIIRNIREGNWLEIYAGEEGAIWKEGLQDSSKDCSSGCTADYTILGQQDPELKTSVQRVLNTKLKIDPDGFYKYDCSDPGCEESKFSRTITITEQTVVGPAVLLEENMQRNNRENICGQKRAQTFVVGLDCTINNVVLYREGSISGGCRVVVDIINFSTGDEIGSVSRPCTQTGMVSFNLPTGCDLSVGQTYALVIHTENCPGGGEIYYGLHDANSYPRGALYIEDAGNWASPEPYNNWDAYFELNGRKGSFLKVTSDVSWNEKGKPYNFVSQEMLYQPYQW